MLWTFWATHRNPHPLIYQAIAADKLEVSKMPLYRYSVHVLREEVGLTTFQQLTREFTLLTLKFIHLN